MSSPLTIELPAEVDVPSALDMLHSVGILPMPCRDGRDEPAWICQRGSTSFLLEVRENDARTRMTFSADLSEWRYWNAPFRWFRSILHAGRQIQIQRDAYFALRWLGATRIGGGEVLSLDDADDSMSRGARAAERPPLDVESRLRDDGVLVIRFAGEYPDGAAGNPAAAWMLAMGSALVRRHSARALLLDIRDLTYRWGDMVEWIYYIGRNVVPQIPQSTVVSDKNRRALSTLEFDLATSTDITTLDEVFDNIDDALAYVLNRLESRDDPSSA